MRTLAGLLGAAILGGGVTAGLLIGSGAVRTGSTTTVIQANPLVARDATEPVRIDEGTEVLTPRAIYERDAPGVVLVRARSLQSGQSPFDLFPSTEEDVATGSGFVIDADGHVLTNAHLVLGATDVRVSVSDATARPAVVVGTDPDTDLALLRVAGLGVRPLELGDSSRVQVGDPTVAIGNPFGLDRTLTTGVVSALQRRIEAPGGFAIDDVIQTDAALNPGNSGGPLIDGSGRVIGINSQIATAQGAGGSVGIGFAVPVDTAREVIPQLKAHGRVLRPGPDGAGTPTMDG